MKNKEAWTLIRPGMSEGIQTVQNPSSNQSLTSRNSSSITTNPSWLLPALNDVEDRMKKLMTISTSEEEKAGDTFAERAEWYYQKRPQLLALLKDLYNGYIILLDLCQHPKLKPHLPKSTSQLMITSGDDQYESDTESTISYQQPPPLMAAQSCTNIDHIVAELVAKNVETDLLLNQVNEMDQICNESGRKIELLKKLIELLESERVILMNENVNLEYKVSSLLEENKGLASEAMFVKRKAAELARCVLRMREDHRVCVLSQKIEDLQEQIYGLEKRNKEYYNMLVKRDHQEEEMIRSRSVKVKSHEVVTLEGCFQSGNEKLKLKKSKSALCYGSDYVKDGGKKNGSKWWEKVKKVDLFSCGLQPSCT